MKGGKEEGKTMDPLFPRLHIDDAGKGGPRPPPRNKMALCQQYDLPSSSLKMFASGSITPQPVSISSSPIFVSQPSSSNVGITKQKVVFPTFSNVSIPGSSGLVERYHSYYSDGLNLNNSIPTTELAIPRPIYCQVPLVSSELMPKMFLDKEKSSIGVELHDSCLKEQNEIRSDKISKLSPSTNDKSSLVQESNTVLDDKRRMPDRTMRKRCYSAINEPSFPLLEDSKPINDKDLAPMQVQNNENGQESSDTSVGESIPGLDLTPDDIVGVIGQRLFWTARKTIVDQQKQFARQIFELHKLIKVQTLISQKNTNSFKKPFVKFPPMNNKLLYVTPLDQSPPIITKPKSITIKPDPAQDHEKDSLSRQLTPPTNNIEKRHISQQPSPKPMFLPSMPANQWLIPVKSPSEGLIYKPYTGPYPPPGGILPVFGNCGPIRLSTVDGPTAYGIPAPLRVGNFSGNTLGQSYGQPYAISLLNTSCASLEVEQSSHLTGVVSECEEHTQGRSATSRPKGEELSLFPTTPTVEARERCKEQAKVQAIRVVPHNPMSASESAARIFQSIQDERKATL